MYIIPWATPSYTIELKIEGWRNMTLDVRSYKVMWQKAWLLGGMKARAHSYNQCATWG